jgi:hypothetical protein
MAPPPRPAGFAGLPRGRARGGLETPPRTPGATSSRRSSTALETEIQGLQREMATAERMVQHRERRYQEHPTPENVQRLDTAMDQVEDLQQRLREARAQPQQSRD